MLIADLGMHRVHANSPVLSRASFSRPRAPGLGDRTTPPIGGRGDRMVLQSGCRHRRVSYQPPADQRAHLGSMKGHGSLRPLRIPHRLARTDGSLPQHRPMTFGCLGFDDRFSITSQVARDLKLERELHDDALATDRLWRRAQTQPSEAPPQPRCERSSVSSGQGWSRHECVEHACQTGGGTLARQLQADRICAGAPRAPVHLWRLQPERHPRAWLQLLRRANRRRSARRARTWR